MVLVCVSKCFQSGAVRCTSKTSSNHCSEVVRAVWPPSHSRRETLPQFQTCQTRQQYGNDWLSYAITWWYQEAMTCHIDMLTHVATTKGPLQVLLVREVNAVGRHIRGAFSNCGAQKQEKGVQSGRNCARCSEQFRMCTACMPLEAAFFQCNGYMLNGIWPPTWAKPAIPTPIRTVVSGLSSRQSVRCPSRHYLLYYSTKCGDMRCTQQRSRQSICSGRELSILPTDWTKPSPTMYMIYEQL